MAPTHTCLALTTLLLLSLQAYGEITSESTTTSRRLSNQALRTYVPEALRAPTRTTVRRVRAAIQQAGGCDTTICFALQGDSSLSAEAFELAQTITVLTSALIGVDTSASFAAVQYSALSSPISPLQSDVQEFVYAVGNSTWDDRNDINLAAGLAYCGFQTLDEKNARQAVVLVGSGEFTAGLPPAQIVPRIIAPEGRGSIYGIVTRGQEASFVNAVGPKNVDANLDRVFQLREFDDLVYVLSRLVERVCDVKVCGASIDVEECEPEVSGELPEVSAEDLLEGVESSATA